MKYLKKYTNADYYKNGEFQQDVAIEAMNPIYRTDG